MMFRNLLLLSCLSVLFCNRASAQTLYVDPVKGNDRAAGKMNDPVASLQKAVVLASKFSGKEAVTIKLHPGLYVLTDQVELNPFRNRADTSGKKDTLHYSIEAMTLPDHPGWSPAKMPVIQSVSRNNKNWKSFDHCTGFQVQRNNVHFRGLKFVGNANPAVVYYYAIERHFPELKGLEVSQCLFVGNRNGAPIQGAMFVQGPDIKVDHSIFYECKNAVLAFMEVKGFSLTHSIVYGSYEGAIWFGQYPDMHFSNNIVANNRCFWIRMKDDASTYTFSNSVISGNDMFMGINNDGLIERNHHEVATLHAVDTSGTIRLNLVSSDTIPENYLHVLPGALGENIGAGIFTR
jgi:hypothetical protein